MFAKVLVVLYNFQMFKFSILFFVTLHLFLATPLIAQERTQYNHRVLFRYRPHFSPRPVWISPTEKDETQIITFDAPGSLPKYYFTLFDGDGYIQGREAINTNDSNERSSYTIEAFLSPRRVDNLRPIFTNISGETGFALMIKNGSLVGQTWLRSVYFGGRQLFTITGDLIKLDQWQRVALRCKETNDQFSCQLFINGEQVAEENKGGFWKVRQSKNKPLVGKNWQGDYYEGYLYSLTVRNYAAGIDNYLKLNLMPQDNSPHQGMPSYHDYLSNTELLDHRLSKTISKYGNEEKVRKRLPLPLLNYHYIPQGIDKVGDSFYLSFYYKNVADEEERQPSLIAKMDQEGKLNHVYALYETPDVGYFGHVGGVAWHEEAFYIPDRGEIHRFPITRGKINKNGWGFTELYKDADSFSTDNFFSFLSISEDHLHQPILWTGKFDEENPVQIFGYRFESGGGLNPNPLYIFKGPRQTFKIQGVALKNADGDKYEFYVTTSYGDNPSHIVRLTYNGPNDRGFPQSEIIYEGPAGLENLDYDANSDWVWTLSESGAKYYQKRTSPAPWYDLYPFFFAIRD